MTPVPWMKSCQWKSNDLFIASRLVLTKSGSKKSSREVDQKCKLHYRDIFTDERLKAETRIILEGQPGSGKTMLSSQLAYDWCCGKLMDIPMVIYLPLKIVDNMTISQAIKMFYIRKGIPITEEDIESMLNSGKKKVYLILDGLEEYNGVTKDGSPSEVMRVMTKEKLSNCIVISQLGQIIPSIYLQDEEDTSGHLSHQQQELICEEDESRSESEAFNKQEEYGVTGAKSAPEWEPEAQSSGHHKHHSTLKKDATIKFDLDSFAYHGREDVSFVSSDSEKDEESTYDTEETSGSIPEEYESNSESEASIDSQDTCNTLEELAFNGLCKGNQQLFWKRLCG
ncbi:putative NACHT, LRR and PYD domains-containing protein 10-like [Apostichopus japonicus]|uniref:Putative NACHT, LRR and PYD domains-containing protein 10-like n=1 Tax=Stichopus japonicus TaxID=307972 RepID=A0A2G8JY42_STIJA|nr:putative NACHT, LRR and PYD domains-containing protein 10-like [Apostichopus japonicus]